MFTWEGDFSKIVLWLQRGLDLSGSGGPSWEQKSIKKRPKNGLQDEIHLGIDFRTILMDFRHQVGGHVPARRPKMAQLDGQDGPTGAQDV